VTLLALSALLVLTAAEERLDHHGAVGLLLATSGRNQTASDSFSNGWRQTLDVGATMNVGFTSDELLFVARFGFGGQQLGGLYGTSACKGSLVPLAPCTPADGRIRSLDMETYGGFRGYFGAEHFKTLFDLDVALQFSPLVTAGPRIAVGVAYDFSALVGAYATFGAQLGFGEELEFKAELLIGLHLRSFLLE
jgi:hypothetical protein